MSKKISIGFMGTPEFATYTLSALINSSEVEVRFVACQPDKPKGRGGQLTMAPTKHLAQEHNIPVITPQKLSKEIWFDSIKTFNVDCIVVVAYGKILPTWLLELPPHGCLNVHGSLLPAYRGASPIHTAILNNDKETGITVMKMDAGLDTGHIISTVETPIMPNEGFLSLHNRLAQLGANLLVETLPHWIGGELSTTAQDNSLASFTTLIGKDHGLISWEQPTDVILAQFRAYEVWPSIFTYQNEKRYKLFSASASSNEDLDIIHHHVSRETWSAIKAGSIIKTRKKLWVKTQNGFISLHDIQAEGKKRLSIESFLLGNAMTDTPFTPFAQQTKTQENS